MSKFIKLTCLYVMGFFFIYEPGLNNNTKIFSIVFIILLILESGYCFICYGKRYVKSIFNKLFVFFILGMIIANLYFIWRAISTDNDPRLIQNFMIIFQILALMNICYLLNVEFKFNSIKICKYFLNIGVIQSLIAMAMLIWPQLHSIALNLYYASRPENVFISGVRIYGISSDYTFFTPIYHGILAVIAFSLALKVSFKYIEYIPFLLLIILLNGRTGFLIFIIGSIIVGILFSMKSLNDLVKGIIIMLLVIILGMISIFVVYEYSPNTFNWLILGLNSLVDFFGGERTGNFAILNNMLIFPTGINFLLGYGFRLYGNLHGFPHSDIGYVNDMFMGGLVYISLLYSTVFRTILFGTSNKKGINGQINYALSIAFIIILLVSNYKGEVMRSGLVLAIMVVIKYVLIFLPSEREDKNGKNICSNEYV